ncbi:MAG: hypothetical protein AAGF95_05850 [Chloroflexota bacterium]
MGSAFLVFGRFPGALGLPPWRPFYHVSLPELIEGNFRWADQRPTYVFGFSQRVGAAPRGGLAITLHHLGSVCSTRVGRHPRAPRPRRGALGTRKWSGW